MNISDIFIVIIISFITVIIAGFFIFIQSEVGTEMESAFEELTASNNKGINYSQSYEEGFAQTETAYSTLNWLTGFMLVGYALAVLISAYMVNTKPIFFVVFFFTTAISIIFAVVISNTYSEITSNTVLASAFTGMTGANYILQFLPLWVAGIGIIGMIIMFARFRKHEEVY